MNADDRQVVAKGVQARPHDSPWLDANEEIESAGFKAMFVRRLISYAVGRVFGRFEGDVPALSDDLFEPPFQLRGWSLGANRSGFPQIVAAEPGARNELARRVVFELSKMFKDPELEGKLAQALGVRDFGEYMLSPTGFFEDHLKLYSKSRRIAPVYWPISSASGKYVLWVYYQAVDSQTLYKCVNDFVEPRLAQAKEQVVRIKGKASRSAADDDSLDENLQMVEELEDMRSMLLDLARHWKPNLNDGIEMTAAPLWRLFKNRFLQGKLKEAWEAISNGEYEWTRHALVYFPERVVAASHHDHATAIAHDLEAELWKEVAVTRRGRTTTEWRPKELPPDELKQIVEAVKKR